MGISKISVAILFFIVLGKPVLSQSDNEISKLLVELENAKDSVKSTIYGKITFYYGSRDKFDSALYYTEQGLHFSEKNGYQIGIANAYNNLGNIYLAYSDLDRAIEFYTKALDLYEKNNYYKKAAVSLGNLAVIYGNQQQYDKAGEIYAKSIQYIKIAKDTISLINTYISIAENYSILNYIDKARTYLDSGLTLFGIKKTKPFINENDSSQFAYVGNYAHKILAKQLYDEKKFDSSILYYKKQINNIAENNGSLNKVELLLGLSNNFVATKKFDSALFYTDIALNALKKDSIPLSCKNVYGLRAVIYEKQGRYEDAYYAFKNYKELSDSILKNENFITTRNIQTRYETQKKDLQIIQLNQQKKSQRIIIILAGIGILVALGLLLLLYRAKKLQKKLFGQKEELGAKQKEIEMSALQKKMNELEQMALRAQMNPHFIFNSLNSVQHFVMNQDVEGVNKYLGAFAHLIRQTLNNSGKPLVSLDEEIRYLETYLSLEKMKSNNVFHYHIDVKENIDTAATFIPGMILQPFVENSIKHGITHKEKNDGLVNISISKNGSLVCLIEDNGIGRQKAAIKKIAAGEEEYESKGIAITMNRIDTINKMYDTDISVQLDDIHDAENKPAGTRVKIEFPAGME